MSVYDLLKRDHRAAARLLDKIMATGAHAVRARLALVARLQDCLEAHRQAEEDIVYAALAGHRETDDLVPQALDDHERLVEMFAELDTIPPDDDEWLPRLRAIKGVLEEHIRREETLMLPRVRQLLGDDADHALARRFIQEKEQVPHTASTRLGGARLVSSHP